MALHLRKRGRWWHYFRHRPKRFINVESRAIITFALHTTCLSEAKLKAAQISLDLENKWRAALDRGNSLASQNSLQSYTAAVIFQMLCL